MDWRLDIVTAVAVDQALMRVDVDGLWEYSLPELRASEQEIADAEKRVGFRLPEQYRSFLHYANGWQYFYQDVNIFGTGELLGGELHDQAEELLEVAKEVLPPLDYDLDCFFPIAASMTQIDLFVIGKVGSLWEGQVIWIAGDIIDEYESFLEYFRSMVAYNKRRATKLAEEHGIEGEPRFVVPLFEDELDAEEQEEQKEDHKDG